MRGRRLAVLAAVLAAVPAASAVAKPYDLDGDGRQELAFGWDAWDASEDEADAGAVLVVPGGLIEAQLFRQPPDIDGRPDAGDHFGAALASGDFNGDGRADLAVGAPWENTTIGQSGAVTVIDGASAANSQYVPGRVSGRNFGAALVAGDLDGDGFDDLAVGAPKVNPGRGSYVEILFGSRNGGLASGRRHRIVKRTRNFGADLAVGDVNRDGRLDLVESYGGRPAEESDSIPAHAFFCPGTARGARRCGPMGGGGPVDVSDVTGDGFDDVVQGQRVKLGSFPSRTLRQVQVWRGTRKGPSRRPVTIERPRKAPRGFGTSVAATHLDGDRFADIVVGATGYPNGRVIVLRGGRHGIARGGRRVLEPAASDANSFGAALTVLDITGDGRKDIVVGAPGTWINGDCACTFGTISVFPGRRRGRFDRRPAQTLDLDSLGVPQQTSQSDAGQIGAVLGRIGSSG